MLDGGHEHPVFTRQSDGRHLNSRVLQLSLNDLRRFRSAFALEVGGVADLDLVVVDVQVDQTLRLAAQNDLVVAGVFEFRPEKTAKYRMGITVRLR